MPIREALIKDETYIKPLLEQLGYPLPAEVLHQNINDLLNHPDHKLLVYELDDDVVAFISIHFVPYIALQGNAAIITYFAVDQEMRSKGIGKEMEEYAVKLAKEKNCARIQLHSNIRRKDAHRFYERQGYIESPKYFHKPLK